MGSIGYNAPHILVWTTMKGCSALFYCYVVPVDVILCFH